MRLIALLLAALFVAACDQVDDAGESPPPEITEAFADDHFLQFLNKQYSLAPGRYRLIAATQAAGVSGEFTLEVSGRDITPINASGAWNGSGGADPLAAGNPGFEIELLEAGGLRAELRASVAPRLFLVNEDGLLMHDSGAASGELIATIDLPRSHTNSVAYAEAYYETIDPLGQRATLTDFMRTNGFDQGHDVHVIFRDTHDLGYGRDMYFRQKPDGSLAFFVNNFQVRSIPGQEYGPLNLDAAIAQIGSFKNGTNAIEWGPGDSDGDGNPDDLNGDGRIDSRDFFARFYTYRPDPPFERLMTVNLDGRGEKAMPVPCIVCHGGRADPLLPDGSFPRQGDTRAHLNPLNVDSFGFSDAPDYTREALEAGLKTINRAVYDSYAANEEPPNGQWDSSAARELVSSWYGGPGFPSPRFQDDYLPAGWVPDPTTGSPPSGSDLLYRRLIAPHCRSCHILRGINHQSDIDFTSFAKFIDHAPELQRYVLDRGIMPLAEITFDNLNREPETYDLLASFLATDEVVRGARAAVDLLADAGPDRQCGTAVLLNGQVNRQAADVRWRLVSAPAGSSPQLIDAETLSPRLLPDVAGTYVLELSAQAPEFPLSFDLVQINYAPGSAMSCEGVSFDRDIRPLMQSDCTECHTADSADPVPPVFYTDPAPGENRDLYTEVRARVNLAIPAESPLLMKPTGRHHNGGVRPGFDLDGDRSRYDLFLSWIISGAPP